MIRTRNQLESDSDAVKSIVAAATNELRSIYHPVKTNVQKNSENLIGMVATVKSDVVGLAEFHIDGKSILVRGLAVSPAHRRQGVATAIMENLRLRAKKEGKTELKLSTIKETGNVKIFLKMGFSVVTEEISEIYKSTQGGQVTLVNMCKNA